MPTSNPLLARLEAIAQSVAASGRGLALLGLGSVGAEVDRLDAYSDLDFFVIARPGAKHVFLDSLAWLESAAPLVYSFRNTRDGYKLLYADGIFAEMAIFEPDELAAIPFHGGRFIWRAPGFTLPVPLSGNALPAEDPPHAVDWRVNEALTNLYIGLGRFQRGEKLSGALFIQGHALGHVLHLAAHVEGAQAPPGDPFDAARRFERRLPQAAALLPQFMPGYEASPAAARAILAYLDTHFTINQALKAAILERC